MSGDEKLVLDVIPFVKDVTGGPHNFHSVAYIMHSCFCTWIGNNGKKIVVIYNT